MRLNSRQTAALMIGLCISAVPFCAPPWKYSIAIPGHPRVTRPGPYALLYIPPPVPVTPAHNAHSGVARNDWAALLGDATPEYFLDRNIKFWSVEVDVQRLLISVAPILIITCASVLLFGALTAKYQRHSSGETGNP